MERIISADNRLIKRAAALKERKYRDLFGEFIAEGAVNVVDTLRIAPARYILTTDPDFEAENAYLITDVLMKKVSSAATPSRVTGVFAKFEPKTPQRESAVYLDRIRDPGNLGTIVRCCAAAGYDLILDGCVDVYNPKVIRSCMSGLGKIRFCFAENYGPDRLKSDGYRLICADAGGENVFKSGLGRGRRCLIIGSEAEGVSPALKAAADFTVSLPMENMESLNAAVAAGVLMYTLKYWQEET